MSVITAADEALAKARDAVQKAAHAVNDAISEIIIRDCWGADEISAEARRSLMAAQEAIFNAHNNLRRGDGAP